MKFELPPLPYAKDALEPHLSSRTLEFHYEKHHKGYLTKLQAAIEGKPEAQKPLEEIIRGSEGGVFNNAAQIWNHTFYWESMKPGGGGKPDGDAASLVEQSFGGYDGFREKFMAAANLFGSGYVWVYLDPSSKKLAIEGMKDADSPLQKGATPVLGMDVWEHAYYLDYQNLRPKYAEAFLDHLVNWSFANANLQQAG